jgi:hypothetical protein
MITFHSKPSYKRGLLKKQFLSLNLNVPEETLLPCIFCNEANTLQQKARSL